MSPDPHLTIVWAAIIALAVLAYVIMDGFDLGVGILFPLMANGQQRGQAMSAIAPVWDGNETWLVLGGGALLAAFPKAFAAIMPAVYPLAVAMLLGLVFRGVAFEFRWRGPRARALWDIAFWLGSLVAAFCQGMILGALVQGVRLANGAYAGGWLDWLSPFSLLTGASVVVGYALLGATWLAWRTEGEAQLWARRWAWRAGVLTVLALAAVSAATPFLRDDYWRRWFSLPAAYLTAQVPLLTAITAAGLFVSLRRGAERLPFLFSLGLFLLAYMGLAVSLFPFVAPPALTLWDAAAPASSQAFLLAGFAIIAPIILSYTAWAYWVFRGKVDAEGRH